MSTLQAHRGAVLPTDAASATLVGRVLDPGVGPCVVAVRGDEVVDLTGRAPTMADLLDADDPVGLVRSALPDPSLPEPPSPLPEPVSSLPEPVSSLPEPVEGPRRWSLSELLDATLTQDRSRPHLLAPFDLQVIKAAGVTFAKSMLERVIEENAKGDPARANEIRQHLGEVIGGAIAQVTPGSAEAAQVKAVLTAEGLWSQYLEVGIGPDPEIFTKAPVLSAVGLGADIGVLARSVWNNPEPEVVLAVSSSGRAVGATLGNDVNLRDFEGRSALLLTEAKDNNASCAIGPFLRLFDAEFGLDDVRTLDVTLRIEGPEGYVLEAVSSMSEMSRDVLELVEHAHGRHHQYPDGFALFTGTMFAPTDDRDEAGQGFTHKTGDVVSISTPRLGALVNTVGACEDALEWTFGVRSLMRNLASRGLLGG